VLVVVDVVGGQINSCHREVAEVEALQDKSNQVSYTWSGGQRLHLLLVRVALGPMVVGALVVEMVDPHHFNFKPTLKLLMVAPEPHGVELEGVMVVAPLQQILEAVPDHAHLASLLEALAKEHLPMEEEPSDTMGLVLLGMVGLVEDQRFLGCLTLLLEALLFLQGLLAVMVVGNLVGRPLTIH
jgi:hypothetical protein